MDRDIVGVPYRFSKLLSFQPGNNPVGLDRKSLTLVQKVYLDALYAANGLFDISPINNSAYQFWFYALLLFHNLFADSLPFVVSCQNKVKDYREDESTKK